MFLKTTVDEVLEHNHLSEDNDNHYTFDEVFVKYYPRLCYFAYQIVKDKDAAEDMAQEGYIKYWDHRHEVSTNEFAIKSFLYNTVKNASLNFIRHEKVVNHYLEQQDPSPAEDSQVLNNIIRADVLGEIYRSIESLPSHCQTISKMSFIDGMKNLEIANELNISVNTVKTQKQRALQLLRLRINPELFSLIIALSAANEAFF